jgi:SH3-like domain-containing protein
MKKIFLVIILLPLMLLYGCTNISMEKVNETIASVSVKNVPDHRTEFCNITAEKSAGGKVVLRGETTVPALKSELIKALGDYDIDVADSILILPDTTVNFRGLAALSVINLRKEPDHAAELVSQAIMGTPLVILKKDGSWIFVKTPDGYLAWTENSCVKSMSRDEIETWKGSKRIIYLNTTGWVNSEPGGSGIVSDIVAGALITETGREGNFIKISLPDDRTGYIRKEDAASLDDFENVPADGNTIIAAAVKLLGIPYLWGGSSSKGADCSGFVQTVFFQNGLILQRDASMQAKHGTEVDLTPGIANLRLGDLLFFGKPDRITHVGIYKGSGEYIHSSGRVMINSLLAESGNFNSYRKNTLVKAMRVIGTNDNGIIRIKDHPWY